MAENRINRELETRAKTLRKWQPPSLLPDPTPEPGYSYRWIRVSTLGASDPRNISTKLHEGWEPVRAQDHPEITSYLYSSEDRYKDNVVIGGLMLCKTPTEFVDQRNAFYQEQADAQVRSADNHFMRQNDPRMPLFAEKRTEVSFGRGT